MRRVDKQRYDQILQLLAKGATVNEIMENMKLTKSTAYRLTSMVKRKIETNQPLQDVPIITLYAQRMKNVVWHLSNLNDYLIRMEDTIFDDVVKNTPKFKYNLSYDESKITVFKYYCGDDIKCVCCGEKTFKLLTLDHENEDGSLHRRDLDGENIYRHLIRVNFKTPYKLRVLCYNCNLGSYRNGGTCPHKTPNPYK